MDDRQLQALFARLEVIGSGIRQYIGARYVPRFTGLYDVTQSYEALDVVDNGSGTSYIAKIPTPAGTPLTDTDYWFLYGSTNGAIVNLQQQINAMKNIDEPGSLQNQIGDLSELTTSDTDSLVDAINEDTSLIQAFKKSINDEIIIIGNSYVQLGAANAVAALYNQAHKFTEGGTGFVPFTGHSITFETLLDSAIADTTIDVNKITALLIVSAVGDSVALQELGIASYRSSMRTAMASMMNKIRTNYPKCRRVMLILGESRAVKSFPTNIFSNPFKIHREFKNFSTFYGFEYLGWPGFNLMFETTYFNSDNVHLNTTGSQILATYIKNAYFGNLVYKTIAANYANTPFYYSENGVAHIMYEYTPDTATLRIQDTTQDNGGNVTIAYGNTLIDTNDNDKPLPPPDSFSQHIHTFMRKSSNGDSVEWLYLVLQEETNGGGAKLRLFNNPSQTTAQSNHFVFDKFDDFVYLIS